MTMFRTFLLVVFLITPVLFACVQARDIPEWRVPSEILEGVVRRSDVDLLDQNRLGIDLRDLNAQESMAESALVAALVGIGALIANIIGLAALVLTLRETRRSNESAQRAVALTHESIDLETRPWISVEVSIQKVAREDNVGPNCKSGNRFGCVLTLLNHGSTPAVKVSGAAELTLIQTGGPTTESLLGHYASTRKSLPEDNLTIFPGTSGQVAPQLFVFDSDVIRLTERKEGEAGIALYLTGWVNYRSSRSSQQSVVRQTRFAYMVGTYDAVAGPMGMMSSLSPDPQVWSLEVPRLWGPIMEDLD